MNQKQYHSLEELPLMMNIADVATVLGISRAGAYTLAHSVDFPAFQIGRRIVVSRENSRLAEPPVHRTKMCLSAKSTRYFTVFVVVV